MNTKICSLPNGTEDAPHPLKRLAIFLNDAQGCLKPEFKGKTINEIIQLAHDRMPALLKRAKEPSIKKEATFFRNKVVETLHQLDPSNRSVGNWNIMFSAIWDDALTESHKHGGKDSLPKDEYFFRITGELAVIFRHPASGAIDKVVFLNEENPFIHIPAKTFHEVITMTESAGMLEFKPGSFDPHTDKEVLSGAQPEAFDETGHLTKETLAYIEQLREDVKPYRTKPQ